MIKLLKNNVNCQGDNADLGNNVCEYEVNRLTTEKVIRGKRNFNANCERRWMTAHPPRRVSPIYKQTFSLKNLAKKYYRYMCS